MATQTAITETKIQATLKRTERLLAQAEREQATRKANQARKDAERNLYLSYCVQLDI